MRQKLSIFLFIIFISISLNLVSSQPVQLTENADFLEIAYPKYEYVTQGEPFTLHFHVVNTTDYITSSDADCYLHLYNPGGSHIAQEQATFNPLFDFEVNILGNNFSDLGTHAYIIQCNTTTQVGFASGSFEVTKSGSGETVGIFFLILILSFGVLIVGYYMNDLSIIALGAIGLYFIGIYILSNGIAGVRDASISIPLGLIILGIAIYSSIRVGTELMEGK